MSRKYLLLFGIIIATTLVAVAIKYYPVNAQYDKSSTRYDWKKNYLGLYHENPVGTTAVSIVLSCFFVVGEDTGHGSKFFVLPGSSLRWNER